MPPSLVDLHVLQVHLLNGQVRSSSDVSAAAGLAGDGPSSRRARRHHDRSAAAAVKSRSVSSLHGAGDEATDGGRRAGSAGDDERRRPLRGTGSENEVVVSASNSTSGRCVSESRLDTAI